MKTSYFDVTDENDQPLGARASYDEVHEKGLWHRGIHVIIYTPDKKIMMQRRSPSLKYHPDEIEVSVGGGVDSGERPEQAAVREIKEELGLDIPENKLHFIGKKKFNHATKSQLNRNFIYSYSVCMPESKLAVTLNQEETTDAFLIPEKKLRRALRRHRIRHVGKVTRTYAYWKYLLDSI